MDEHKPLRNPEPPRALRVLIIEDDHDNAASLAMLISAWGHATHLEHDARHAVAAAMAYKPDVMLLDIRMPGMSGYDVAAQVRAVDALRKLPLIAISGLAEPGDIRRAHAAGIEHYVVKPFPTEELEKLLAQIAEDNGPR